MQELAGSSPAMTTINNSNEPYTRDMDNEIRIEENTIYGTRYDIDGRLKAPDGTWLNVRSAWFFDNEGEVPRFVTAHPTRRRGA